MHLRVLERNLLCSSAKRDFLSSCSQGTPNCDDLEAGACSFTRLICRSVDKLNAVKKECEKFKGVEAKVLPFDFSTTDESAWVKLEGELKALEIGVLINNAAVSHEFPVSFLDEGSLCFFTLGLLAALSSRWRIPI